MNDIRGLLQVILLSATMPVDVMEVTQHFMRSPIKILVKKEELTLEGIKQFYVQVMKRTISLFVKKHIFNHIFNILILIF